MSWLCSAYVQIVLNEVFKWKDEESNSPFIPLIAKAKEQIWKFEVRSGRNENCIFNC
jgi:hypothetical protein